MPASTRYSINGYVEQVSDVAVPRADVREPADVLKLVADIADKRKEYLVALYLSAMSQLIARETIAVGSLNVARATPRDILEPALRHLATTIILSHNHPSGVAEPSEDDVAFTRSIGRACDLMGVSLADHVVVAGTNHVSLRARGIVWSARS